MLNYTGRFICFFFIFVSMFFPYPSAYASSGTRFIPENFSQLAKSAENSVVNIRTVRKAEYGRYPAPGGRGNDLFDEFFRKFYEGMPRQEQRSLGSGFLISSDGYIVTNNHVVENADLISVKLKNGKEYDAKKIGSDPNTDLALIKIKSGSKLPYLKFGDSKKLKVGEWVVAIGSPFGLEQTVTAGIVSAKGRVIQAGPYDDFIQTDASINPGNSGGPLLNLEGNVVGINTAILARAQGIGFAIPSDLASNIIEQLKNNGEVVRGWLGVEIHKVDDKMAEYYGLDSAEGVFLAKVFKDDPAEKAGLKSGDIIISINGIKINNTKDLTKVVAGLKVGSKVKVVAVRNGKKRTFSVKIGKRKDRIASLGQGPVKKAFFGVNVRDIDKNTARQLGVEYGKGILVSEVNPEGKGYDAGIRRFDVILQVNHKDVNSAEKYFKIIKKIKKGEKVSFFIKHYNRGFGVVSFTK
ncbi:MAG: peptidase [Deltaproteobacteria bacterium]|nr:MAG: peptidase [Deltaproteobacteria bacterium]